LKVLVISDTHGQVAYVQNLLDRMSIDWLIHLGDHNSDMAKLKLPPNVKTIAVAGNCDHSGKEEETFLIEKIYFFICHGHRYGVKGHYERLLKQALHLRAKVALFGHTHLPFEREEEGVLLLNPGSAGLPRENEPATALLLEVTGQDLQRTWIALE